MSRCQSRDTLYGSHFNTQVNTQVYTQGFKMCCSFINITCAIQLWCLKNYDSCVLYPVTRFLLSVLYYIDLVLYDANPRAFLAGRSEKLKSQNFASLGRMILGDHPVVSKAINTPQIRDAYLGRARLIPSKFPDAFPLFLSDALEEEKVKHKAIHDYFWITTIPVANKFVEKNAEVFQGYVKEIVESEKGGVPDTEIISKSVIKYIFHSLLGRIDERIVEITYSLFFPWGLKGYISGALKLPLGCCCLHWKNDRKRSSLIEEAVKYVSESPHMANYESFQNISKEEYSELLFSVCGIAGCLGTSQLIVNIFNEIPKDFVVDVTDPREVMLSILEAARIRAPVNK